MIERNRRTSRQWFEEVWNGRDAEAARTMSRSDAVGHCEGGDIVGLDEFLVFRDRFIGAFPDLAFEVESVVADGDDAVVRWVARGTHTGDALGIPACRKPAEFRGTTWHRYEDGVIAEVWDSWNLGGLIQHLTEGPGGEDEAEGQADEDPRPAGGHHGPPPRRIRPGDPLPPAVARRQEIAARIREVREEVFGRNGGPEVARRLNLPARTWYNYETGVSVPAEVLFDFAELTGAEVRWVMTGGGPRYQVGRGPESKG